ncbi:MAG: hypothetical protein LH702_29750 [Phormidesmis sp. CAN_BIN44]|nr:hypothetical protein [Phormidesmis sp. CAN_BIN44]
MNKQSQWLFEAASAFEIPTTNFGSGDGEWEIAARRLSQSAIPRPNANQQVIREVIGGFSRYRHTVASLPQSEQQKIDRVAQLVVASFQKGDQPIHRITVVGHADRDLQRGSSFERKISGDRAQEVQQALMQKIDSLSKQQGHQRSLSSAIHWRQRQVGSSDRVLQNPVTETERARNRRVEIFLVPTLAAPHSKSRLPNFLRKQHFSQLTREFESPAFPTPTFPTSPSSKYAFAKPWQYLISFRPPTTIQSTINKRFSGLLTKPPFIHFIEDAEGEINLDFYPVQVARLPTISGRTVTAEEFLSHIRLNINSFVDTGISEFTPYEKSLDAARWTSSKPEGAVISIAMRLGSQWASPDSGSVVVSEFRSDYWIFSTLWTPKDLAHPVSGNRQFGFSVDSNLGFIFYARGADRTTRIVDNLASRLVFSSAHSLWKSFQNKIEAFVNANGGVARILGADSTRNDWNDIRALYFAPTTPRL